MVTQLIDVLYSYNLIGEDVPDGKVIIQSFSKESLKEINRLAPSIPLILLLSTEDVLNLTASDLKEMKSYVVGVGPNYKALTKKKVKAIRQEGLLIHAYTVNNKRDMKRLIKWGVTGMFTNYPDRLNEVILETGQD